MIIKYPKYVFVILLAIAGFLILIGISSYDNHPKDEPRLVAIATLVSHPALDSLLENIKRELNNQGFLEGSNIRYVVKNASGQMQLLAGIAKDISGMNPAVVVAITTPVAQAMAKETKKKHEKLVFSAVTDPVGAGIMKSLEQPEKLITGASDVWPYNDQLKLIKDISPNAKRIVVIFNPGEAASQYGMRFIRQFAPSYNFKIIEGAVNSTNEVFSVAENLSRDADAIFLSSDSTAISGVAAAARVAIKNKIPLFVGDSGTVEKGGVAAASIGYDQLGIETGKLVARVLRGEQYIPIVLPDGKSSIVVNTEAARLMGVKIPHSILRKATVLEKIIQ